MFCRNCNAKIENTFIDLGHSPPSNAYLTTQDLQRKEFWEEKDKLIGQIIEIRADSISKSQDGENWSLRFPRFKSFRGFDKKEKL